MWALALLAQAERPDKDPFRQPEIIWGTAGLAVALFAGAFLVWIVDRWRKRNVVRAIDSTTELTNFRQMYEQGEITEEEYVKLRNRVADRVKPATGPPPPDAGAPPNPASPA